MLLQPKVIKHRKVQRSSTNNPTTKNIYLLHANSCGLKALKSFQIKVPKIIRNV